VGLIEGLTCCVMSFDARSAENGKHARHAAHRASAAGPSRPLLGPQR
jgi:hypothetical protein